VINLIIGEKVNDVELVTVALNGFPKSWEPFVKGVCAWKNLPDWQRLWDDNIQEEIREESKANKQGDEEEENLALVSKTKKGKGRGSNKKGDSEESASQPGNKDLSNIKCFTYHKNGHYASQCQEKKGQGKMQTTTSIETQLDEFAVKFEKDFSLVSCLSTNTNTRIAWYLDSGAFHHMTKAHELFNNLMEKDSGTHVELGDNAK